jgi:hypothetical protein
VSSHFGTQTSTLELSLAKPVRSSKKFVAQSSGLSIGEKASPVGVKVSRKRPSSTSVGGSDATPVSVHELNLIDLGSSTSDGKTVVPASPQKCPKKSPALKKIPKPRTAKGDFEYFLFSIIAL